MSEKKSFCKNSDKSASAELCCCLPKIAANLKTKVLINLKTKIATNHKTKIASQKATSARMGRKKIQITRISDERNRQVKKRPN